MYVDWSRNARGGWPGYDPQGRLPQCCKFCQGKIFAAFILVCLSSQVISQHFLHLGVAGLCTCGLAAWTRQVFMVAFMAWESWRHDSEYPAVALAGMTSARLSWMQGSR